MTDVPDTPADLVTVTLTRDEAHVLYHVLRGYPAITAYIHCIESVSDADQPSIHDATMMSLAEMFIRRANAERKALKAIWTDPDVGAHNLYSIEKRLAQAAGVKH